MLFSTGWTAMMVPAEDAEAAAGFLEGGGGDTDSGRSNRNRKTAEGVEDVHVYDHWSEG